MANGLALLAHRQMILRVVGQAEVAMQLAPVGMAAFVEEEAGLIEEALLAGEAIQLDQAELDLLVARHLAQGVGAESCVDEFETAQGYVEQSAAAAGLVPGDSGLVEVAEIVEFVAGEQF